MIRAAKPGDETGIKTFLSRYAETSMFLRSNLRDFGLQGADHPRSTRYWLLGDPITAVFGLSRGGFLMMQAPDAEPQDWAAFAEALAGCQIVGVTGEHTQVAALRVALDLDRFAFKLDHPEPLYRLDLNQLRDPGAAEIRPPTEADAALLFRWVLDYDVGTLGAEDNAATRARIEADIPRQIAAGRTRLMIEDGTPVAKTAFNAQLPDMVQVGGVYTPPALRGRGYARRVVAAHLKQAAAEGAQTAILFTSGPAACRAYEAIGFERIGDYALAILKAPVVIGAVS